MTRMIQAEFRKLVSVRSTWAFVAAVVVYPLISIIGAIYAPEGSVEIGPDILPQMIRGGSDVASVTALLLGILGIAGEYRHRTIVPSLLAQPNRFTVLTAKLVTYAVAGVALATLTMGVNLLGGGFYLSSVGVDVFALPASDVVVAAAGVALVSALFGAIGVGLGAVVRNQTAAVAGALVWLLAIENALPILLRDPALRDWTLGGASGRLFHLADPVEGMISAWAAAGLIGAVALVLGSAGVLVTARHQA